MSLLDDIIARAKTKSVPTQIPNEALMTIAIPDESTVTPELLSSRLDELELYIRAEDYDPDRVYNALVDLKALIQRNSEAFLLVADDKVGILTQGLMKFKEVEFATKSSKARKNVKPGVPKIAADGDMDL